jgi:hypothetical protein
LVTPSKTSPLLATLFTSERIPVTVVVSSADKTIVFPPNNTLFLLPINSKYFPFKNVPNSFLVSGFIIFWGEDILTSSKGAFSSIFFSASFTACSVASLVFPVSRASLADMVITKRLSQK